MTVEEIVAILDELIEVHQKFIDLGREKTEVLKKNDMPALDRLVKEEEQLTRHVQQIENKRQQAIRQYLDQHYYLPEDVTLEELIHIVPIDARDALKERQLQLVNEVITLKDVNDLNRQLIQQSLQLVTISMNLIQPQPPLKNYQRPDRITTSSPGQSSSRFDSKA